MKPIEVEWEDTTSENSSWMWREDAGKIKPLNCFTVGYKVPSSNRRHLKLASMKSERGRCSDIHIIPRGCIVNIRKLDG